MSSLRIRVQVGDDTANTYDPNTHPFRKFIYVIDSPSKKTIDDLTRTLQTYMAEKFSFNKMKLVQLRTNDGFIFSKSDICAAVLKDNEHIICIDMQKFVVENLPKLDYDKLWLDFQQHDQSDDREKLIQIGLNSFSELFIQMQGILDFPDLYIFGFYELLGIAHEKPIGTTHIFSRRMF